MPEAGHCHVLIVDDSTSVRDLLELVFEEDAHITVRGAASAPRGITLAAQLQPRVIVLDYQMPQMTGLQALPHLLRAAPDAQVIVWTASAAEDIVAQKFLEGGAHHYICKAAGEPTAILELIRGYCA